MSALATAFNNAVYAKLVAKAAPKVITTEEENDRILAIIEPLMEKGEDNLSPEEDALLELLARLVHEYEEDVYPIPDATPVELLRYLIEENGLKQRDLAPILGAESRVSEILSGKRGISKAQAKGLAERFKMTVDAFL